MLPRPYVVSYIGEKGHQFLQEPWIILLFKSVETFIMASISNMKTSQYWETFVSMMNKARDNIPKQ